jgi:hypothetical protein
MPLPCKAWPEQSCWHDGFMPVVLQGTAPWPQGPQNHSSIIEANLDYFLTQLSSQLVFPQR